MLFPSGSSYSCNVRDGDSHTFNKRSLKSVLELSGAQVRSIISITLTYLTEHVEISRRVLHERSTLGCSEGGDH